MKNISIYIAFIFVFLLGALPTVQAQKKLIKAQGLNNKLAFSEAVEYYEAYFSKVAPDINQARELAECYTNLNDSKSVEKWYAKVLSFDNHTMDDVLKYAHILRSNQKYEQARLYYTKYADMPNANTTDAKMWIKACDLSLDWMANPTYHKIKNEEVFNTEYADFGVFPFQNGYLLTSDRKVEGTTYNKKNIYAWTGKPYLKQFYFSDVNFNNNKAKIEFVDILNNEYHNGPVVYDSKNNILFFTRTKTVTTAKKKVNNDPTHWKKKDAEVPFVNRLEIYTSSFLFGKWEDPKPFQYNNAEVFSVGHPALSPCGTILYFSSDMPGGFGGADIYYSILNSDATWSTPKNAGNVINTKYDEVFPYFDANGKLFFSSNGHPGMGGLDLFSSIGRKDIWEIPENLRYPINSSKDDFSIIFTDTDKKGFFASNREGGKGDDDIYSFELAPPSQLIIRAITKERAENQEDIILPYANLDVFDENEKFVLKTDENGIVYIPANCNEKYVFKAYKSGFLADHALTNTSCNSYNDTVSVQLVLDKIYVGKTFAIKNIFYDFDKWNIRKDAEIELENVVRVLTDNPQISIELGSHTDSRGTFKYNETLSQKRAESAVAYIISRGISAARITAKGYGEYQLVNHCKDGVQCSDEEHQMNRRTEFKITSIKE